MHDGFPDDNNAPVLSELDATIRYLIGGAPVLLDDSIAVFDAELAAIGNYAGASINLSRAGGADSSDQFHAMRNVAFVGDQVLLAGESVGDFFQFWGILYIRFNARATQAGVGEVLSSIGYSNDLEQMPGAVQLEWVFSDGVDANAASMTGTTTVKFERAPNSSPSFAAAGLGDTLGGAVTYRVGAAPVLLDASVAVFDPEHALLGSYAGTSLRVTRATEASDSDVFHALGNLVIQGANLVLSGVTVGAAWNGGGRLYIEFNGNATQAAVNEVLSSIGYSSAGSTPAADAQIEWLFLDDLDLGRAQAALGSTTVHIAQPARSAPTFVSGITGESTLDGLATYKLGDAPVLMDGGVQVFDAEMAALGTYAGANLTLMRSGPTANEADLFHALANLAFSGIDVLLSGRVVGSLIRGVGALYIEFNEAALQSDVNEVLSSIGYSNTGDAATSVQIAWEFSDGTDARTALTARGSSRVDVLPGNTAPVLDATRPPTLLAVEDMQVQWSVAALVSGLISDAEGPVQGIALTAADSTLGEWEFSIDAGGSWHAIATGSLGAGGGLLLGGDALIRLSPRSNANGTLAEALTFRAWDMSAGTAGEYEAISATGGSEAFSQASVSAIVVVAAINDAPVRTAGVLANLVVAEDGSPGSLALEAFAYAPGGGSDEAPQALSYTVRSVPAATVGRVELADGTEVTPGRGYTLAQLHGLRFVAAPDAVGVGAFSFSVSDGLASIEEVLQISVTAVNDAPVRTSAAPVGLVVAEDSGSTSLGLETLAYTTGGGADEAGQVLAYTVTSLPASSLGRVLLADGTRVLAGTYTLADLRGMRFVTAKDAYGTGEFTFAVRDNGGVNDTTSETLHISVLAVDDRTVVTGGVSGSGLEDSGGITGILEAVDIEGLTGASVFSISAGAAHGVAAVDGATGSWTYRPAADFNGSDAFTVRITDDAGNVASQSVTVAVNSVNDAPTGTVQLTGTAVQGMTLVASNTIADVDGLGAIAYQWLVDGTVQQGASGSSFALGQQHVGKAIAARAVFTDLFGTAESVVSATSAPVANVNDAPVGTVSVAGSAIRGANLTALPSISDADGVGAIHYQWLADGTAIVGATGSTFTLSLAEVGRTVSVQASYVDGFGHAEQVASTPTAAVTDLSTAHLDGMVYHWRSHALLSGVTVEAKNTASVAVSTDLIDLRGMTYDAATDKVSVQVWINPSSASSSLDFTVRTLGTDSVAFTSLLGGSWVVDSAEQGADVLRVAAIGDGAGAAAGTPLRIGTLTFAAATGADVLSAELTGIAVGSAFGANVVIGMGRQGTGVDGTFGFATLPGGSYVLSASRSAADVGTAVTSADALAALRIAVGINPNTDPDGAGPLQAAKLSPYQLIAADVNGDGRVSSADALAILRMAVKLPSAPAQQWQFVSEALDLWNEAAGASSLTRNQSAWDAGLNAQLLQGTTMNVIGVLRGDVNGSWAAAAGSRDLDETQPAYFQVLGAQLGVPLDMWGI